MKTEKNNSNKYYISEDEEIRDWFLVTSNRKKVWNVQLWLFEEFKRICKKHNLRYYASWGTMLWAVRHKWFIPRDDDMDFQLFRKDYEKLLKIIPNELPKNIKLQNYFWWYSKLVNIETAAFWDDNWWDNDNFEWIFIDIFPIDYLSKIPLLNVIKLQLLSFLRAIMVSQKSYWLVNRMIYFNKISKYKKILIYFFKKIFKKINCRKIYKIHENIAKLTFFKWNYVYNASELYLYHNENIFKYNEYKVFENSSISVPIWYDKYLKKAYWDYIKPIIYEWWHHCRYSVDKSYKDIIKTFDKSKKNEDNYNNCKDLFVL